MLKVKRIMCLLSLILLFYNYKISIITPFHALATDSVENKNLEMVNENQKQIINITTNEMQSEKLKVNELKEKDESPKNSPEWKEFILTFYTSLEYENSSAGAVTCENKPLSKGGVANNIIPLNTKLYLEGYGQVTVNDKGSEKYFNVDNRLDVFVEREPGESDKQYAKRVNNYGVQKVHGYIVN